MNKIQLNHLHKEIDKLQKIHGHPDIKAVYGAGCIKNPKILFLFMNPTAKNISANPKWNGLRAPWLGTKNIWKLFNSVGILDDDLYQKTQQNSPNIWTEQFSFDLYDYLNNKSVYITNLAKCTQIDARGLKDKIFKEYLEYTLKEILEINPQKIISFGNQVSSILLGKNIKVSDYDNNKKEVLTIKNNKFDVYPIYYPVGQGMRNIDKAIKRIKLVLKSE